MSTHKYNIPVIKISGKIYMIWDKTSETYVHTARNTNGMYETLAGAKKGKGQLEHWDKYYQQQRMHWKHANYNLCIHEFDIEFNKEITYE
jgi:hypothetical protein